MALEYAGISEWIIEDNLAYRYILGTDKSNPNNRVAAIEKTPRVQITERFAWVNKGDNYATQNDNIVSFWISGYKGNDCFDEDSRTWCDEMLSAMYGFEW